MDGRTGGRDGCEGANSLTCGRLGHTSESVSVLVLRTRLVQARSRKASADEAGIKDVKGSPIINQAGLRDPAVV